MAIFRHYSVIVGVLVFSIILGISRVDAASIFIDDPFVSQWAYKDIGIQQAWKQTTGSHDVVVAVIDNGFDTLHPDLRDNVWQNTDEIAGNKRDDDNNGYIDDVWGWSFVPEYDGDLIGSSNPRPRVHNITEQVRNNHTVHHGTAVAGLIGAVGGNGIGMSGIAPVVSLMDIRLVDESGTGTFDMLPEAIRYAVDNGAHIINMSVVGDTNVDVQGAIQYAYDHNVVVIAAAGNNYRNLNVEPMHPVCGDAADGTQTVLGVSAIDINHKLSVFSNTGSSCIDITAPGSDMMSTAVYSPAYGLTDQYLSGWAGTSFGAPLVSGVAALIKSIRPEWGPDPIYAALLSTANHTPGQDENVYADLFGTGLLRADKAVQFAIGRRVQDIQYYSPEDGKSLVHNDDVSIPGKDVLQGVDDVVSYIHNGLLEHASVETHQDGYTTLTRYSDAWKPTYAFQIPVAGPLSITVLAEREPRFVVAPAFESDTLFWVYTADGILLREYTLEENHTGVSLDHLLGRGFVTLSSDERDIGTVRKFTDIFGESEASFQIEGLGSGHDIAAVDLDDDGVDELAIGGASGSIPIMYYYEMDGRQLRKFFVYGAYTHGFSLHGLDYDDDAKDDILIVPMDSTAPVRVWSGNGRKIGEEYLTSFSTEHSLRATLIYQ